MAMKKGPTKGSGGKHRNALRGKGPTPKAENRVYHKAYKAKKVADRRKMADPRLAARRRAAKFASESDDLVIGRNAVLEALRCGVPASTLYIAARIEHDDRTREIVRLAGIHGLHLMEADRLEMDRIARSSNHQGIVMKAQPFQYSSLAELVERADKKSRAMEAANSEARAHRGPSAVHRARRRHRPAESGCGHPFRSGIRRQWRDSAGASFRFGYGRRLEGVRRRGRAYAGRPCCESDQGDRKPEGTRLLQHRS